ncbi:MAG TPA: DUF6325 family protein [Thermomicrobiales bacterium]|nr:DUF6325 family protein [Thermomicrobiales bacterium]
MTLGPVDFFAVKFPGNQFQGEIVPALKELVDSGTIQIVDLTFARKDADGNVDLFEMHDLDEESYKLYESFVGDVNGMLSEEDIDLIAGALEPNSSAALMLFENSWARRFVEGLENAQAEVIISERVPRVVMNQLLAAQEAEV